MLKKKSAAKTILRGISVQLALMSKKVIQLVINANRIKFCCYHYHNHHHEHLWSTY